MGLAPAAHGGNRTGRVFTGDESGNWLFRALHEAGLASQPESVSINDGLELRNAFITAAVHCAPPANKPTREEFENCRIWLLQTLEPVSRWRVIVALGRIAYEQTLAALKQSGVPTTGVRRSDFAHRRVLVLPDGRHIVCAYHPSQQNTFTGKLTRQMLLDVFLKARDLSE